jgi:hypothetical protein
VGADWQSAAGRVTRLARNEPEISVTTKAFRSARAELRSPYLTSSDAVSCTLAASRNLLRIRARCDGLNCSHRRSSALTAAPPPLCLHDAIRHVALTQQKMVQFMRDHKPTSVSASASCAPASFWTALKWHRPGSSLRSRRCTPG